MNIMALESVTMWNVSAKCLQRVCNNYTKLCTSKTISISHIIPYILFHKYHSNNFVQKTSKPAFGLGKMMLYFSTYLPLCWATKWPIINRYDNGQSNGPNENASWKSILLLLRVWHFWALFFEYVCVCLEMQRGRQLKCPFLSQC